MILLAISPQPVKLIADASPSPEPYPVIGRTRSKRYCALEVERTNGAITVALTNDKIIATGISRLRDADLDNKDITVIYREKTMHDLRAIAAAVQMNLRAGAAQVADLRALSVKEPDATRSPELKLLADQMDAIFDRQQTVGGDLAKMLTIIDGRYARANGMTFAASVMPEDQADHARDGIESIDQRAAREPLNRLFSEVADDFADRTAHIGQSEDAAAVHAPKATEGC